MFSSVLFLYLLNSSTTKISYKTEIGGLYEHQVEQVRNKFDKTLKFPILEHVKFSFPDVVGKVYVYGTSQYESDTKLICHLFLWNDLEIDMEVVLQATYEFKPQNSKDSFDTIITDRYLKFERKDGDLIVLKKLIETFDLGYLERNLKIILEFLGTVDIFELKCEYPKVENLFYLYYYKNYDACRDAIIRTSEKIQKQKKTTNLISKNSYFPLKDLFHNEKEFMNIKDETEHFILQGMTRERFNIMSKGLYDIMNFINVHGGGKSNKSPKILYESTTKESDYAYIYRSLEIIVEDEHPIDEVEVIVYDHNTIVMEESIPYKKMGQSIVLKMKDLKDKKILYVEIKHQDLYTGLIHLENYY